MFVFNEAMVFWRLQSRESSSFHLSCGYFQFAKEGPGFKSSFGSFYVEFACFLQVL